MGGILRGAVAMHARNGKVRITSFLLCLGLLSGLSSGLLGESLSLLPGHAPPALPLTPHAATSLKQGTEPAAFAPVAQVVQVAQQVPAPAAAQDPGSVIRVSSNLVSVPVSVTDSFGQPLRDLSAADFQIKEDGQLQRVISLGEPGKTPIDLALLLDVSGSIRKRFQFEQKAATNFLKLVLKPGDTVSVFSLGRALRLVEPRTAGVDRGISGVMALQPTREPTAFFAAVIEAARYLAADAQPGTRRALLVMSDGEDNNSLSHDLGDALRELQRADCLFYSINPSGPAIRLNPISLKGQQAMAALAAETGGAFVPATPQELEAALGQIASELQAQYLLGYYSKEVRQDGEFRAITVSLPGRPNLRVRARRGYYATKFQP